jgi:selenium metabolism protein YedF
MKQNKRNIIDAKNKNCPLPLIILKKALKEHQDGFVLLINNQTAKENIERFLSENHIDSDFTENNGVFNFLVNNPRQFSIEQPEIKNHSAAASDRHVICIKSDKMGHGSDELGLILLKAFIYNLKEVAPLPSAVIFYNSGIKLALEDSSAVDSLKTLESSGVKILVCGTCVDYYHVKDRIEAGVISNMYEITEQLTNASHIIYP